MKWRIPHQRANDSTIHSKEPGAKRVQVGVLRRGFTIVELLIVVVVIAILAAITIVAYSGITAQAKESALKSDLTTAAKKLHVAKVEDGSFPGTKPSFMSGDLSYTGGGNTFCVGGQANGKAFHITDSGNINEGSCPLPVATTMQSFTSAHCLALTTYTGSNPASIVSLTDSRGGTARTYEVAKLADGKCWMLTNLKLGSTSGTITLTPADSNVASNFTLPQLTTTGSASYDNPQAVGPVPGDTGIGATNYGYLYNWPAATAGATQASNPGGSGDAQYSICPANWRLPTGSWNSDSTQGVGDFPELDLAFGGTADAAWNSPGIPHWMQDGPFKSAYSGGRGGSFYGQGSYSYLWASTVSPNPSWSSIASHVYVVSGSVSPGVDTLDRNRAISVRCVLS